MADDKKFGNNDFEDIYSSSEKDGYEDIYSDSEEEGLGRHSGVPSFLPPSCQQDRRAQAFRLHGGHAVDPGAGSEYRS